MLAASAVLAASWFRVFEPYELQTYDWRCRLRVPRPTDERIVFIDIWNDTVERLGAWPFDREYHAALIEACALHGVKALALDINFVERRTGDYQVFKAARQAKNVYFVTAFSGITHGKNGFEAKEMIARTLPPYARAAKALTTVNVQADMDGKRRRVFPRILFDSRNYYQLSFRIAMDVLGVKPEDVKFHPGRSIEFSPSLKIPLDEDSYYLISFAGSWEKTFKHYSYYDILVSHAQETMGEKPLMDLEQLRGKVCFVGLTTVASHDTNPIPIQSVYPQVGIHANVLNSILKQDFIRRPTRTANAVVLALLLFWVLFLSARFKPVPALFAALGSLTVFNAVGTVLFVKWGIWADLFYPSAATVLIYAAATLTRTLKEMQKRELMENELKIASQIQKSFLPETLPQEPGIELAVYMKPAKAVGGDLYTFIPMGEGRMGVMVGDVSGKGTPAALFMAKVVSEFKFSARGKFDPAEVLAALNDSISSESTGGLFVTLAYAIFDVPRRKVVLSNGGHLPVVSTKRDGTSTLLSIEDGMPIGVMPGTSFANREYALDDGDTFAFYSDGVSEARNRKKDEYGIEALQAGLVEVRSAPAQETLDENVRRLNLFMGKADQHDDITLIIVKIGGEAPPETAK